MREIAAPLEQNFSSLCILSRYERPDFLKNTLDSVRLNTKTNYELLIHDDGSEDYNTRALVCNQAKEQGAQVILNPPGHNQGQGVSLNRMFNMAKGDPIIKLDADIKYSNGWLTETRRLLESHPEIGLLGLLHYYHEPVDSRKTAIHREDDFSVHTHILGSAFAVRRRCWEELGPFEEYSDAFAEDYAFQVKVTESEKWKCALPKADLVTNLGMGLTTSTVVVAEGEVKKIHKTPYIIRPSESAA